MKKFLQNIADYIRETDKMLIILCVMASLYGCALVYSATYRTDSARQFIVQLGAVVIGVLAAVILSLFDYKNIAKGIPVYVAISLALLVYTYFFGLTPEGSENKAWIRLPFNMTFQVSEFLKITMILSFSKHISLLTPEEVNRPGQLVLLCLRGLAPAGLIAVLQKDIGTSLILGLMFLAMMFAAGVKARYFIAAGAVTAAAAPLIWFYGLSEYMRERFSIIFDLESDPLGMGYQQLQGLKAIGSGGLTGYGYLNGPKVQAGTVPKAYNDFIFATAGEELGLLGCLAIVLLLLGIVGRILYVSSVSRDRMGTLICIGVFAMFASQAIINLGMCLAVFPVIGVTLPFFSAGGTSLLCLFLGIGLVLSVYIHRNKRQLYLREL